MKRLTNLFYAIALLSGIVINVNCKGKTENKNKTEIPEDTMKPVTITQSEYGETMDGEKVTQFSLKNTDGIEVDIITYGGRITSLRTPDSEGNMENVVLGFDDLTQYEKDNPFFGA